MGASLLETGNILVGGSVWGLEAAEACPPVTSRERVWVTRALKCHLTFLHKMETSELNKTVPAVQNRKEIKQKEEERLGELEGRATERLSRATEEAEQKDEEQGLCP